MRFNNKVFVLFGLIWISFSSGIEYGLIPGISRALLENREELNIHISQLQWIFSTKPIGELVGFFLTSIITDKIGRRWPFVIFSITAVISWIIMICANQFYQFMLSRIIGGISSGALLLMRIMVTSEYTSPKSRVIFLNLVTAVSPTAGICLGSIFGIYLHWKIGAAIATVVSAFGIIFPFFWIESPFWLVSKGKFGEGQMAFWKLHKRTPNTEMQVQLLVRMEKRKMDIASETNCKPTMKRLLRMFLRKYFWKLLLFSIFIHAYLAAAESFIPIFLANDILHTIRSTYDSFLPLLLVEGLMLLGSCLSCLLISKIAMRPLIFSTGFIVSAILISLSGCIYLKSDENYLNWIRGALLVLYFIIVNAGPESILPAIYSEMFPLELKFYIFSLSGIILVTSTILSSLIVPYMINFIDYYGLLLINAAIMSASLIYMWFVLPETKGKTLQEIEMYYKTGSFDIDEELSKDQSKTLI